MKVQKRLVQSSEVVSPKSSSRVKGLPSPPRGKRIPLLLVVPTTTSPKLKEAVGEGDVWGLKKGDPLEAGEELVPSKKVALLQDDKDKKRMISLIT